MIHPTELRQRGLEAAGVGDTPTYERSANGLRCLQPGDLVDPVQYAWTACNPAVPFPQALWRYGREP